MVRMEESKATLFLNQRFKSKTKRSPKRMAMMIEGSLMAMALKPKIKIETFWTR